MSTKHPDGSVTLTDREVGLLRRLITRWERGAQTPGSGNEAGLAVLDIAQEVRELLNG